MKAYVLNKDPGKNKFEEITKTGIFVGYCEQAKAYRVWLPEERKLVVSRDIRVIEQNGNEYYNQTPNKMWEQEEIKNIIQVQDENNTNLLRTSSNHGCS